MKQHYTKQQIAEAIKHWESVLKKMNESGEDNSQIAWFYGKSDQTSTIHKPSIDHPLWISSKPFEALRYSNGGQLYIVKLSNKCKAIDFSTISREQLNEILVDPPNNILDEFLDMDWSTTDSKDHRQYISRASLYVILQKFQLPQIAKFIAVDGLDGYDDCDQIFDTLYDEYLENCYSETIYEPTEDVIWWVNDNIDIDELKAAWSKCDGSKNTKLEYEVDDDSIFLNYLSKHLFFNLFVDAGYNAVVENEFNAKSLAILSPEAIDTVIKKCLNGKDEIQDFINELGGEDQIDIPFQKALDCLNNLNKKINIK